MTTKPQKLRHNARTPNQEFARDEEMKLAVKSAEYRCPYDLKPAARANARKICGSAGQRKTPSLPSR